MNQPAEKALSYIAGNENIETVTVEDLQRLVAENPYFPVTQFLLAKKLQSKTEPEYQQQFEKTVLYFSNPYWLQYQLTEAKGHEFETFSTENFVEQKSYEKASIPEDVVNQQEDAVGSSAQAPSSEPVDITQAPQAERATAEDIATAEELAVNPQEDAAYSPAHVPSPSLENEKPTEVSQAESATPENLAIAEELAVYQQEDAVGSSAQAPSSYGGGRPDAAQRIQANEEMAAVSRDTNNEAENFLNELSSTGVIPDGIEMSLPPDAPPAAENEVVELEEEMAGVTHTSDEVVEDFLDDASRSKEINGQPEDDEHDKMFQNIKAMLDASSEEANADTNTATVPIDPYFTIDYFASQGINLQLDASPKDQLGQNLKKFTQWLKHMKKLGPEDATEAFNRTETEADIQQIADSSNTVREVVTEAMATVLEKQGKKDKAIELYNKLSFLNPHKSTYFADKIKKLNGF